MLRSEAEGRASRSMARSEGGARGHPSRRPLRGLLRMRSGDLSTRAQDEDQHLGDRAIKRFRNILAELDLRQRLGQRRVLFHRNAVLARERQNRLAGFAASFRDHARHWHGGFIVLQRDRERRRHVARSMKRPGAACFAAFGGAPTRNRTSAGSGLAARSAGGGGAVMWRDP